MRRALNVKLEYPYTAAKIAALRVGQIVAISGRVVTGRDRLHRYLTEGGKSPVDLKDGAIYHCGPVVVRESGVWAVKAAGPTTSTRMDGRMPWIIEHEQVRVIVGKGGMSEATRKACAKFGCVYLHPVGGAACSLAQCVQGVAGVHMISEFGSAEAVWELLVAGFEAVVSIDTRGRSLHRRIEAESRRVLESLLV